MLQFILILLGLLTSNPDANSFNSNEDHSVNTETINNPPNDTGGETSLPPKR
ncbi:hypothetical protein [Frigoriflavimonas asaccharolytica]|uniref:Uncharacterized protein n=1 Tax=Frigoriflavimonas asaccharolytica TaxID=2735899 RepID=A0A8J8K6R9_9FLAO|nr:hypothetical protein [Frigoriflavimonas asaccharolytica]NRS91248.1 hypothetical protein [Frigoriflavimonas asaccharolytica]